MYTEPLINMEHFKKDYYDGLSAKNIKDKYCLTGRQYRKLLEEHNLTRDYDFLKQNPHYTHKAKYYSKIGNRYLVRKVWGTTTINYGSYLFEEEAKYVVSELKKVEWDRKLLDSIVQQMKSEEWHMNLYNRKIQSIRTTIEAEKMKEKPNKKSIKKLEKWLQDLLEEVE